MGNFIEAILLIILGIRLEMPWWYYLLCILAILFDN